MSQVDARQTAPGLRAPVAAGVPRSLLSQVSIVIPIGPDERSWPPLVADLANVGDDAELLLVAAAAKPPDFDQLLSNRRPRCGVGWITTTAGRAHQLNVAAAQSTRPFVWFLHADSRVAPDALVALQGSLESHPHALHYFDLTFQDDGPAAARLNAIGAGVRSNWLGLPFGDQGLCLSREVFRRLGGFDEGVRYGEDHLLVWAAHRNRVPLRHVNAAIATSARKYLDNGWLTTTLVHGWRTWRQAVPEFVDLLWSRIR